MRREHLRALLAAGVAVALCVLLLTRYGYYRLEGPAMYKVDRWTGRTWFVTPQEVIPVPRSENPAKTTTEEDGTSMSVSKYREMGKKKSLADLAAEAMRESGQ